MTAVKNQSVRVYTVNFEGCTTKAGFFRRLAKTLGIGVGIFFDSAPWRVVCRHIADLSRSGESVQILLYGFDGVYQKLPRQCDSLLRVLRAAGQNNSAFRSDAVIGKAKWKI